MKYIHAIAGAQTVEDRSWAVADGLVRDFKDAKITPGVLEFKDAAKALGQSGFSYEPATLGRYWRVASTFPKGARKTKPDGKGFGVKTYDEIVNALWATLDKETRENDLRSYASRFFATAKKGEVLGALAARAWARAQAKALKDEKQKKQQEAARAVRQEELQVAEDSLFASIAGGSRPHIEAALEDVNRLRRLLGMEIQRIEWDIDPHPVVDEEATAEAEDDRDAEREHQDALSLWEKELALLSIQIRSVANVWVAVRDDLTEDDRESGVEQINQMQARMDVIKNDIAGEINEKDLQAALAAWASE